jgi:hypothetical protein
MPELELELDSFYFDPAVLTGTPAQSLKIELRNEALVASATTGGSHEGEGQR